MIFVLKAIHEQLITEKMENERSFDLAKKWIRYLNHRNGRLMHQKMK